MSHLFRLFPLIRQQKAQPLTLHLSHFIGSGAGFLIIAFVSDKMQRRKLPAIICAFPYLSLWVILAFWNGGKPPVPALYPICFLMGFFAGFTIVNLACAKEVVPPSVSGMAMGLVNMGAFLSAAVLQIIFGHLLDLGWQGAILDGVRVYPLAAFQSGLILVCAVVSAYVIGALLLKETRCRDTYDILD